MLAPVQIRLHDPRRQEEGLPDQHSLDWSTARVSADQLRVSRGTGGQPPQRLAGGIQVHAPRRGRVQMLRGNEVRGRLRQVTISWTNFHRPQNCEKYFLKNLMIDINPNFIYKRETRKLYLRIQSVSEFSRSIFLFSHLVLMVDWCLYCGCHRVVYNIPGWRGN